MLPGQTFPEQYEKLLQEKCAALKNRFLPLTACEPLIVASIPEAYRLRAEFRIWHQDNHVHYAMMAPGKKEKIPIVINQFPPGSLLMQTLMPVLLEKLNANSALSQRLFQLEFLTSKKEAGTTGEVLITLIYHRHLDDLWIQQAQQLKQDLCGLTTHLDIVGRSRGQKICVDRDLIEEQFTIGDTTYCYEQIEGSFTQPNGFINEKMLGWASTVTRNLDGDLLELYCGNGNFTLPLSKNFNKVLATEVSKTAINAATHNIASNGIHNIEIARLSSEEAVQAFDRLRPFRRLAHIDLDKYQFSTIFVDPPRAGLDEQTLQFTKRFDNICYISCSPDSLIANLQALTQTHRIAKLAFFDQFPYTQHMECGVFLQKTHTAS